MKVNYSKIGLKAGLEVHQQLDSKTKLFCSCRPQLFKNKPEITFIRRLRPTQSELGQIDPAAFFEFQKGMKILYEANRKTSCLVEMDEEPPHELNKEALKTALLVSLMFGAKPVNEIHVMRKTVIDGSNTTGFQRTCLIALGGGVDVGGKLVPLQHVSLEEDAARIIRAEGSFIRYRIDRLGIPLVEVTTSPLLYSPQEAERAALAIGRVLRATRRVKRGLGTIRQDLNISIREGALTEIKGVQELNMVSKVVEYEVQRQLNLLRIRDELRKRGVTEEILKEEFVDVTNVFKKTRCHVIIRALDQGKRAIAICLSGFAGLLRTELAPGRTMGSEMADVARFWGKVGGIFHTDELPGYGITNDEVLQLKHLMKMEKQDATVFVADKLENATDALKAIIKRARVALEGVPEETRVANSDGTTHYMRPRPGAARMYPETDVAPIRITQDEIKELRGHLPELPAQKMERLMKQYGLNQKLAKQVFDSEYVDLFEEIVSKIKVSPTIVAVTLTETFRALKRDGVEVNKVANEQIKELFNLVYAGKTTKEAIPDIIAWLSKHERVDVGVALRRSGLAMLSDEEIEEVIDTVIQEKVQLIEKKGIQAFESIMNMVMRKVRQRAKVESVSTVIRRKLEELS